MLIEGKFPLTGEINQVFSFLLEPDVLQACIPGAESIKRIDEKTYDCVVKQRVGPISVKLLFKVTLAEIKAPNYLHATGTGNDAMKAGTFSVDMKVNMSETAKNEIEVAYKADVSIVGRLATFGERIMRAKAQQVGDELKANLQSKLKSRMAQK